MSLVNPSLRHAIETAQIVYCKKNQAVTGAAILLYAMDHNGRMMTEDLLAIAWTYKVPVSRTERFWSLSLMANGYLDPTYSNEEYKYGVFNNARLNENSVVLCPSFNAKQIDGYIYASNTYGIRVHPSGGVAADKTDGFSYNINTVNMSLPYLADSINSWRQSKPWLGGNQPLLQTHRMYSIPNSKETVHTRHQLQANTWFPDGRVEIMGREELLELPSPMHSTPF